MKYNILVHGGAGEAHEGDGWNWDFFGWVSVPVKGEGFMSVLARHDLRGLGFALLTMGFGWVSVPKRGWGFNGGVNSGVQWAGFWLICGVEEDEFNGGGLWQRWGCTCRLGGAVLGLLD